LWSNCFIDVLLSRVNIRNTVEAPYEIFRIIIDGAGLAREVVLLVPRCLLPLAKSPISNRSPGHCMHMHDRQAFARIHPRILRPGMIPCLICTAAPGCAPPPLFFVSAVPLCEALLPSTFLPQGSKIGKSQFQNVLFGN